MADLFEIEGFEDFVDRNQDFIESLPADLDSPLEYIIRIEEMKSVINVLLTLPYKELVVVMMKNYDGDSLETICDYFYDKKRKTLQPNTVSNIEKRALKRIRRNLKFKEVWSF